MRKLATALAAVALVLAGCATATGAVVGAGIGSLSGNAGTGALIGGSVGAVIDIVD
ncbi:hypothetical protein [Caulobacter sp. 17J65-9]|uniref:hypothetical protein n=1 Tax=Caulobacter sp. 17J65-9 TaxID=2709382 RepID=UPI0013D5014F|nr:hypothetical protein [Caulobacter sp. 17J65-9]